MSNFFTDFNEEVKNIIQQNYAPADMISKEFEMTTEQIVDHLRSILPFNAVDDFVVYRALRELKFEPKEKEPLQFYWYFRRIKE